MNEFAGTPTRVSVNTDTSASHPPVVATTENPNLDPTSLRLLYLMAFGHDERFIGDNINYSQSYIKTLKRGVREILGTSTNEAAIAKAIDLGIIDATNVLNGFDTNLILKLSPRQREILEILSDYNLNSHERKDVGAKLGIDEDTVKTHLAEIYMKFEIKRDIKRKKWRAVAIFAAARKLNPTTPKNPPKSEHTTI